MLYAILCYHAEQTVCAWTADEEAAVMARLADVEARLARAGRLGPVARLMPTTAAVTLRKDCDPPRVFDGPFAETQEQLLGFFVIDCASLEAALETATALGRASPGGAYEIRPISRYRPVPGPAVASVAPFATGAGIGEA